MPAADRAPKKPGKDQFSPEKSSKMHARWIIIIIKGHHKTTWSYGNVLPFGGNFLKHLNIYLLPKKLDKARITLSLFAKAMSFCTLSTAVGIFSLTIPRVVSILESRSLAPDTTSPLMVDALLWNPVLAGSFDDFS